MTDSELSSFVGVAFWVASLIEEEDILGAANRKLKAKIRRQVTENPILQSILMIKSIWVHHLCSYLGSEGGGAAYGGFGAVEAGSRERPSEARD